MFGKFGRINRVSIKKNYGFIDFETPEQAKRALDELHDTTFHGRQIIVEFAGEKTKRREALGPSSEDKCYNCNRPGHWASEC